MGCVSRAAAVPAHQQFVSRTQALIDQICCLSNLRIKIDKRLQSLRCGGNRFLELKKMRHGVGALDWDEWSLIQLFSAGSKTNDQPLQILANKDCLLTTPVSFVLSKLVFPTQVGQEYETAERQLKSHLASAFRQDQISLKGNVRAAAVGRDQELGISI